MSTMDHVRYLSEEIGPRGSTTPQEADGAKYAARVLDQLGLAPITEPFRSARSGWRPYALYAAIMLVGCLLFLLGGQQGAIIALVVAAIIFISVLLELSFRPNPLRWVLPKGDSQNVWAQVQPREEPQQQVVLMGHVDTHRTPLAFSSSGWLRLYGILVPLGLVSSILLIILFAVGIFDDGSLWRYLSLPLLLIVLGLFAITFQADFTPFARGANDNATGAAIVLSLSECLSKEPLTNTLVWTVVSGCEEVGCYGADAFASSHKQDLDDAYWISIDSVGGRDTVPTYLTKETFFLTTRSDPGLIDLADHIASEKPELGAMPQSFSGAYTESAIGGKHGFRVLPLIALRPDGGLPEWHRPTDVFDKVESGVVAHTETFLWELLQKIDKQGKELHQTS
ncbi:MAG: M28 family peptidase [Anaerolineales bacterium]|nr:M28 family peptidase [Anaerolineales bacterium]